VHTPPYPGLVLQNSYFPTTYWITAKRPKALAALRRAFPQAEWDVLTTTIDAQIPTEDKLHPAKWLDQLSQHYLSGEPIIQSTHNFLRILKQDPGMTQHHLEEAANKVMPSMAKSTQNQQPFRGPRPSASSPSSIGDAICVWCGGKGHPNRRDCPASNAICHGCGKKGH